MLRKFLGSELLVVARCGLRVEEQMQIAEVNEIENRKAVDDDSLFNRMLGLGETIFKEDSVTLQRNLRSEWIL